MTIALLLTLSSIRGAAQRRGTSVSRSHSHAHSHTQQTPRTPPPAATPPAIPKPQVLPASAFMPNISARAVAYQRSSRVIALSQKLWVLFGIWLLLATGTAVRIQASVKWILPSRNSLIITALPPTLVQIVLFMIAVNVVFWLWRLPFDLISLVHEKRYGFGTQTLSGYLADALKALIFQLPAALLYRVGYGLLYRFPGKWWLPTWGIASCALCVLFVVQPVLLAPRFNKYTKLPESPLRRSIQQLAADAGIAHAEILVEDTSVRNTHVNAYVTGIGPSARIVINDTAVKVLPDDQMLAMVGHEIGHYRQHHAVWLLASSILGLGVFLWFLGRLIDAEWFVYRWNITSNLDLAIVPAISLAASLFLLAQGPIESAMSRSLERRADMYGLQLVNKPEAAARLMAGFGERDLADPDPPAILQFWFGSHPTLKERIETAISYRDEHAGKQMTR